jgi:hypothetical protein
VSVAMQGALLLATLRTLELELHQPLLRSNGAELERRLHPAFRECGRSGLLYSRTEVLSEFTGQAPPYHVWAQEFEVEPLGERLALLIYKSAHIDEQGRLSRPTIRSSVWQQTNNDVWLLRFHQGTPTAAFQKLA